jgi:hypothetical protein
MSYKKEPSKCCVKCGVEWLSDLSNKVPKRALCFGCKKEYDAEWKQKNPTKKRLYNRHEKKSAYTFKNRTAYWQSLRKELKSMKKREEWVVFIKNRMDEILNDKALMDYINDTDVLNKFEN